MIGFCRFRFRFICRFVRPKITEIFFDCAVFEATVDEFESIMSKQSGSQDETVVRLRGLPWDASESDIAEFFKGMCRPIWSID